MKTEDFWKIWKWEKAPFMGELIMYPDKSNFFIDREELIADTALQLKRQIDMCDSSITIVCGSPGVGKSTFIDQLLRTKYPNNSKRISLIDFVTNAYEGNNTLSIENLLSILSKIEEALNEMLEGKNKELNTSSLIKKRWDETIGQEDKDYYNRSTEEEKNFLIDLFHTIIVPKCKRIHELKDEIEQYYIAIDDVDYLCASQQNELLSLLCTISGTTINPSILYTARPLAAGIAKLRVTSLIHHRITEPIRVSPLDVNKIIEKRIKDENNNAINPFEIDSVKRFLTKYTNGNIRVALEYVKKGQENSHKHLSAQNHFYSRETFIDMLFGKKNNNNLMLTDEVEQQRDIFNIFSKNLENDPVPVFYITLVTIDSVKIKKLDTDFVNKFNNICKKINQKEMEHKEYNENQISLYLKSCHKMHLIRRVSFESMEEYLGRHMGIHKDNPLYKTYFSMTAKGDELLLMTRDKQYQKLCGLQYWRKEVQKSISNMKFNLIEPHDGSYLLEDTPYD